MVEADGNPWRRSQGNKSLDCWNGAVRDSAKALITPNRPTPVLCRHTRKNVPYILERRALRKRTGYTPARGFFSTTSFRFRRSVSLHERSFPQPAAL